MRPHNSTAPLYNTLRNCVRNQLTPFPYTKALPRACLRREHPCPSGAAAPVLLVILLVILLHTHLLSSPTAYHDRNLYCSAPAVLQHPLCCHSIVPITLHNLRAPDNNFTSALHGQYLTRSTDNL